MPDPADNEFAHGTNHSNLKGDAEAGIWERVGVCMWGGRRGGCRGMYIGHGQISGTCIGQYQFQVSAIAIVNQNSKAKELYTNPIGYLRRNCLLLRPGFPC